MSNMREYWAREAEMMRDKSAVLGVSNKSDSSSDFLKEDPAGQFYVYFTNDSEYMLFGKDFSAKSISEIIGYAKLILSKNGITNLTFRSVDKEKAKKYPRTDEWHLFLAIVSSDNDADPGLTNRDAQNGCVGIYDTSKKKWLSYVNHYVGQYSAQPFPYYYSGYLAAHEILHQLLYKASYSLDNEWAKFAHENEKDNLNMDGKLVKVPKTPLTENMDLRESEKILPTQKAYIKKYFDKVIKK
jgi:hypothetical protein